MNRSFPDHIAHLQIIYQISMKSLALFRFDETFHTFASASPVLKTI